MASEKSPQPPRRRWKWLKRLALSGVLLLLAVVIFHRPILLGLLRWAGPKGAATQGLSLEWLVEGSLFSDLKITDLKTGGGPDHWLPEVSIGELSADYDTRALLRGEYENGVRSVTLHDVEAKVDLRKMPPADPAKVVEPARATGKPPPLVWPKKIDIHNVSAEVTLADGARIIVKEFTLQVGEGMPGVFSCKEFRQEPGGLVLENLHANVGWEPRRVTFRGLKLPKDVELQELAIDIKEYEAGKAAVALLAGLGKATFEAKTSASGLFQPPLLVTADVRGKDLRSEELTALGLPKDVFFEGTQIALQVKGDPLTPPKLDVDLSLSTSNLKTAGVLVDQIAVELGIHESKATLKSVKVTRGANTLTTTAEAELPADLAQWQKTTWTANVQAELPEPTQFLAAPPAAKGLVRLTAKANGTGATPTQVTGQLTGEKLAFETYTLPALLTTFAIDGKEAKFEIPALALGAGNELRFQSKMLMEDAMPVEANWSLKVTDPGTLFTTTGLPPPAQAVAGTIETKGNAKFAVKEVSEQKLDSVLADLSVTGSQLAYGDGKLQGLDLKVHVEKGKALIQGLKVTLNETHFIEAKGDASLTAPHAYTLTSDMTLPQFPTLNELLKAFGVPAFESGALFSHLESNGQLLPLKNNGKLSLSAAKIRTTDMPEAADATLEATFAGTDADLSKLEATLGPWRLNAKGKVNDKRANLAELQVWQNKTLLLSGHALAPFDIMQPEVAQGEPVDVVINAKDLKIHEILTAAGIKDMPTGVLNADVAVKGRLESLSGKIKVNLSDIKAKQSPPSFKPATLDVDTVLEKQRIDTAIKLVQPPLQPLTVEASLPFDPVTVSKAPQELQKAPIRAKVKIPETDLAFVRDFAPEMIRSLSARMKVDANVSGTVGLPIIQANVEVDAKDVNWVSPDMPSVRDVRVRIRSNDRKVTVQDISAILAGGRVQMNGTVDATDPQKPLFDLKAMAREALVFRDPTTSMRANADLTCRGNLASARVDGLVELVRGRVFKEIDFLPALGLPTDVPDVPPDTQRSNTKLVLPEIVKDWLFNIRVKTRDPILLAGNLANGALSADVHLGGTGANPLLTGGANIDRLLLKLPFSMIKVTQGVVTLNPAQPFDPQLDIRGESRMGRNEITLYIYGSSSNPKTRFTSTPPMSEPDIVTLLATGTTLNGSAGELASEAASRAAILFITEIYRKTFNKKKVVREEPPRLNLTFNPSGADRSNDAVQATYDLTDRWRFIGRFTQTGRMRAAFGYLLRFGKAARAMEEPARVAP